MSIIDHIWKAFRDFVEGPGKTMVLGPKSEAEVDAELASARKRYFEKNGVTLDPNSVVDLQKSLGLPSDLQYRMDEMAKELDMPGYTGKAEENVEAIKRIKREIAKRTLAVPK